MQLPPHQLEEVVAKNEDLRKALLMYISKLPTRNTPRMHGLSKMLIAKAPQQESAA
jgi:hypothetical protein